MSEQAFQEIMDRWEQDPAFRTSLKQDPVGTVEAAGIEVDDDVRGFLQQIEPDMSDEELRQRVSKGVRFPR